MTILQKLRAVFGEPRRAPNAPPDTPPPDTQRRYGDSIAETVTAARECNAVEALIAYTQHANGHVREAAMQRAAELQPPRLAPAVAARLNDWVPQVRDRAQDAMLALLPSLDPVEAIALLPAVQQLRGAGRADHTAWLGEFERFFISAVAPERIIDAVLHPSPGIARACYRLAECYRLADRDALVMKVLARSKDIVLSRAAVEAIANLPEARQPDLYRLALDSSFGMVRAIALRRLLSKDSVENDALAIDMLIDMDGWVRLIASGYLSQRGIDSAPIYAARLGTAGTSNRTLRACLMGLAGLRRPDYLDLVREFTSHPAARVQVTAFLVWLYLAPSDKDEIARRVLHSRCHRVRKLVLVLVREHGAFVAMDTGLELLRAHGDVDLMLSLSRSELWAWPQVIVELEPRSRGDAALRARLKCELASWIDIPQKMQPSPTRAQCAFFKREDTAEAMRGLLGQDVRRIRKLAFELSTL